MRTTQILFTSFVDSYYIPMSFKQQLLIILAIYLGLIVLLGAVLIFLGKDISEKTGKINQLQNEIALKTQSNESLAVLRQDYAKAQSYETALNNILPSRDQLLSFRRELETMASQSKIDFSVSLGKEEPQGTQGGAMGIGAVMAGGFEQISNFLKTLENSRYLLKFDNFDLTREEGKFRMRLNGQVFYF